MPSTAIVWFRRDLRVTDHPALHAAATQFDRVVPAFVLDDALLDGRYRSASRARFMLGCLQALDGELRRLGAGLVVRRGRPERELVDLAREVGAGAVLWSADVAPYAQRRDARVTEALSTAGVRALPHPGTYVADDVTAPGTQRVYSPYFRAWRELRHRDVLDAPARLHGALDPTGVPAAEDLGIGPGVSEPMRAPGEPEARRALDTWLAEGVDHYHESPKGESNAVSGNELRRSRQDGMARIGTSVLSPYLRWGCLSPRELEARAEQRGTQGASAWRRQLAWRDFYAQTLLTHPDNLRTEQQERYRDLDYDEDPDRLAAWAEGRTGFPLVDAGMRQLALTGWMHNRVRLVTGSLLTKELHLDWRAGEDHFARLLLDGEPAQNNGNWQWIASVGTDPAPYFRRMYNPARHQERFDPTGEYVRRYVPELRDVPDAKLAEPWTMTELDQQMCGCIIGRDYPAPIVDRSVERERAKERYRAASAGA